MTEIKTLFGNKAQKDINKLLEQLRQEAMSGQYIYRGEPKCYEHLSSSLYRQCRKKGIAPKKSPKGLEWCEQLWELQKDIVVQTRRFLPGKQQLDMYERSFWGQGHYSLTYQIDTQEYEILCQIQHYGGATNLVDFTTDYLVALFFACEQKHTQDGRVILSTIMPLPVRISDARVQAQKSVFVQVQDGFLKPDYFSELKVPSELKIPLLQYLKQYHAISSETLFPDIHGAVRYWNANQSFLFLIREAEQKNKENKFEEAVENYDKCLSLSIAPDPGVLTGRGIANLNQEEWQFAKEDLSKAISLFEGDWKWSGSSKWGFALFLRGVTHMHLQHWDDAFSDLQAATNKNFKVANEFRKHFKSVAEFENEYNLCLPTIIKELLNNSRADDEP